MKNFSKQMNNIYTTINNYYFMLDGRMKPEKFSRESKLGFAETCLVVLRGSKRSLQAAINTFLKESKSEIDNYSKQAFSQRRQYIKPEAFLTLFRKTVENFYEDEEQNPKTFQGMHVFAIDGTAYNLPNTKELEDIYGVQVTGGAPQVQAQGSCLYDVLNDLLIDVQMLPIKSNERKIAQTHVEYLCGYKPENNLILFDRGYPSLELIEYLDKNRISYVMRCNKKHFISEIRDVREPDAVIHLKNKKIKKTGKRIESADIRVLSVPLENGTVETLITNILDESITSQDFKELYHLRWGIEEKYDELKNKMKIEAFSGTTPVAVLQDFYATMCLTNMVAYAEKDCAAELESINKSRERKYEYRINNTMAIASVKDSFIEMIMETSQRKQKRMFDKLFQRLLASTVPIRPERRYVRKRKHKASKFPPNRKDV